MDYIVIFDVIITVLGIYLVYAALKMKRTGEISTLLVNREELTGCRDKKGFIGSIYKKMSAFGTISILFGVFGFINDVVYAFGRFFDIAGVAVFLVAWFWFSREVRKGRVHFF